MKTIIPDYIDEGYPIEEVLKGNEYFIWIYNCLLGDEIVKKYVDNGFFVYPALARQNTYREDSSVIMKKYTHAMAKEELDIIIARITMKKLGGA